jgi:hypothetical protein
MRVLLRCNITHERIPFCHSGRREAAIRNLEIPGSPFGRPGMTRDKQPRPRDIPARALIIRALDERAQGKPGAQCTRSLACKNRKHASKSPQVHRKSPAFPARMVLTACFVLSPAIGLFVTVACGSVSTSVMPASRHQDHTTSPSAFGAFVVCTARVHRIPLPTFVTTAKRPSFESGTRRKCF